MEAPAISGFGNPVITILALDPSTDVTGVAVVSFDEKGCPRLWHVSGIHASVKASDSDTERFARIAETRRVLSGIIRSLPCAVDIAAWEVPPPPMVIAGKVIGLKANAALQQAVGAYMSCVSLRGIPALPVYIPSCKAMYGNLELSQSPNLDKPSKEAKRALLKANAILWANETFGLDLTAKEDGIADALSVACAAFKIWHAAEEAARLKAQQKPMFGKGSGTKRTPKPKVQEVLA